MNTRAKKTLRTLGIMCGGICTLTALFACQPQLISESDVGLNETIKIPVSFNVGDNALSCDQSITVGTESWRVNHLAFFVSSLAVKTAETETWQPIAFVSNDWQTETTSLQWFNSECVNNTLSSANQWVTIDNAHGLWNKATEVKFDLAVPFAENHKNPLTQPSPLNISEMFWSWQLGHKFLRLDLQAESTKESSSWSYHLGSVGCQSASSMRAPLKPCTMPNRFEIVLQKTPNQDALHFDLLELLKNVQPSIMRSCMFQQVEEVACIQLANNLQNGDVFRFHQTAQKQ